MGRRKNPLTDLILGKVVDLAADHYSSKKMKRKNPLASSSYIPVKIEGNKLKMRLPNRNPGTLRQAKAIASKLGINKNPNTPRTYSLVVRAKDMVPKAYNDYFSSVKEMRDFVKEKFGLGFTLKKSPRYGYNAYLAKNY